MKKLFYISVLIIVQFAYSQTYVYNKISMAKYSKEQNQFIPVKDKPENSTTTIIVDEKEKTIKISRKFIETNSSEAIDTTEIYHFVKKEENHHSGNNYIVPDLKNKKHTVILVSKDEAGIMKNCDDSSLCETLIYFNNEN